jgi:hypothetical protein
VEARHAQRCDRFDAAITIEHSGAPRALEIDR